jgi:hypothetical protein
MGRLPAYVPRITTSREPILEVGGAGRPRLDAGGVSPGVVLMDASYGSNSALREAITGLGLSYVAA